MNPLKIYAEHTKMQWVILLKVTAVFRGAYVYPFV